MSKPLRKEDVEFLNVVSWAKTNDRTAYNCIRAYVLMFSVKEHGRAALNGRTAIELRSLSKSELIQMLDRNESMKRANPSTAAHFEAASEFIRSELMSAGY